MYDQDSSDISLPSSGSQLLSLSPMLPTDDSESNPADNDLSISELSLSDRTAMLDKSFTLLAHDDRLPSTLTRPEKTPGEEDGEKTYDQEDMREGDDVEQIKRNSAKSREEKLRGDIFVIRKLNASFATFNEALQETATANDRVALQLEQTDALLNKYVSMLSKSEQIARLIFDEDWHGAEADEDELERDKIAAEERKRREIEERVLAARREQEQLEQAEREQKEQEEKEIIEKEKREASTSRRVRGVRGTRSSMRGARGATTMRPASSATSSTTVARGRPAVSGIRRPTTSTTIRGSTSRGTSRLT
ncbi:hypothetical protein BDQ12DRAFT_730752 [Crucibulum laeve]|uniref:DASH complex subunit DUO1 n=1 Tax=Crucibulum laeve TaxID=68775 RepID=A0A5C3MK23_9AGAR|nr:hypothetical protein BDQ12DRAFT_730752 [Crucibulum laeve]